MKIERLGPDDVRDVAALHGDAIGGLLTRLGPSATRAYYAAATKAVSATGFVARDSTGLAGFVFGSTDPAEWRREVIGRDPWSVVRGVVIGILRRPSTLKWIVKSTRGAGPDSGHYDATCPELIYLAVSPAHRGRGVGRQLVDAFSDSMRAAGRTRYELSVDADNRDAVRFYERLGFERVGAYDEFGIHHLRYALKLSGAGSPR